MSPRRALAVLASTLATAACRRGAPLPYSGFVDAPVSAVASPIAGKVDVLAVREGDRVRKGDLLAQLEASVQEAAVEQASASL